DLLHPCGEIDGRADAGEVEPAGAADIAEQDLADMQRDAETKTLAVVACRIAHGIDTGARLARRLQHARADRAEIAAVLLDRKHRQQAVAHEFEDFAAMLADRRHLAIEILIEDVDYVPR